MARITETDVYDRIHEAALAAETVAGGPFEARMDQVVAETLDDAVEAVVAAQERIEEVLGLVVALRAGYQSLQALRGHTDETESEAA